MRSACSLLILAACNQVYGLDPTRAADAAFYDAPADAPYACPPLGTPPRFSRMFEQAVLQACTSYTVSVSGRALAVCPIGGRQRIAEGQIGDPLTLAPGFDEPGTGYELPRIGPDGNLAIVKTVPGTFHVFARDDAGWHRRAPIVLTAGPPLTVSGPTRGGRIVAIANGSLSELADDGNGNFAEIRSQTLATLGLVSPGDHVHITADGRRIVAHGGLASGPGTGLVYSDRPDLNSGFGAFVAMPEIGFVDAAFMTEDCDRLYFSALNTVFSARPL